MIGPVPGREQAVVEVQPPVRVELVAGHRRLVDERAGLDDEHAPPGPSQLGRHDAATRSRTDDDHVGLEADRLVARARDRSIHGERPDRRELARKRRIVGLVADRACGSGFGAPGGPGSA